MRGFKQNFQIGNRSMRERNTKNLYMIYIIYCYIPIIPGTFSGLLPNTIIPNDHHRCVMSDDYNDDENSCILLHSIVLSTQEDISLQYTRYTDTYIYTVPMSFIKMWIIPLKNFKWCNSTHHLPLLSSGARVSITSLLHTQTASPTNVLLYYYTKNYTQIFSRESWVCALLFPSFLDSLPELHHHQPNNDNIIKFQSAPLLSCLPSLILLVRHHYQAHLLFTQQKLLMCACMHHATNPYNFFPNPNPKDLEKVLPPPVLSVLVRYI